MTQSGLEKSYADAMHTIALAEGQLDQVRSQLQAVADAVEANEELRSSLSDRMLPAGVRSQIVDDLLAGKTSEVTNALVSLIVSAGHGRLLPDIVALFVQGVAADQGKQIATVTSAVALSEDQKARLAESLAKSVGTEVEIRNIVDSTLVGGVITVIGDKVIDGSLRSRLDRMQEVL